MSNIDLPPPPNNDIRSQDWKKWFNLVYRKVSSTNTQTILAAQPIDVDKKYVSISGASGSYAVTLDAPTIPGVRITIQKTTSDGSTVTLALTNIKGQPSGTTCNFSTQYAMIDLVSAKTYWLITAYSATTFT